ncbi:MAG: hypothetical protein ACRD2W_09015, partial [Acidimicrobiales bacterium]
TWVSRGPGPAPTLIASGPAGAARSPDGGRTWELLVVPEGALLVEASPVEPTVLYAAGLAGTSARVWTSRDAGRTWAQP